MRPELGERSIIYGICHLRPARGCRWQSPGPSRSHARRVGVRLCSIMFCPASRWVKLVRVFTPVSLYNRRPSPCPSIIGDLEGLPGGQRRRLAWCRNLYAHGSVSVGWQPRALECGAEWTSPRIEYRARHLPLAGLVFWLGLHAIAATSTWHRRTEPIQPPC